MIMLTLMGCCLLNLQGCSSKPVGAVPKVEKLYIPEALLTSQCNVLPVGGTVRSLASAYVSERACRRSQDTLLEYLRKEYTNKANSSKQKEDIRQGGEDGKPE